jgi:hypothetical protein
MKEMTEEQGESRGESRPDEALSTIDSVSAEHGAVAAKGAYHGGE